MQFQPVEEVVGMSPEETMATIVALRQQGRMEEAAAFFEEDGVFVIQPDSYAVGRSAIKEGLVSLSKVFPVFHILERTAVQAGGIALHHSRWSAPSVGEKGEPVEVGGLTSDVLRQQPDGSWRVAVDNPWGGSILDYAKTRPMEPAAGAETGGLVFL